MAYDEDLADRIREMVHVRVGPSVAEKRMFGGLAFLLNGNMAVAASGQGGLMVRVDPAQSATLTGEKHVSPMVMRGREMAGWLRVDDDAVAADDDLRRWVSIGLDYAGSLPTK
jgi:TfoX/Sxy family transcriptional regulator of competence genes